MHVFWLQPFTLTVEGAFLVLESTYESRQQFRMLATASMSLVPRTVAVSALLLVCVPASQNLEEAFGPPIQRFDAQWRLLPLTRSCLDQGLKLKGRCGTRRKVKYPWDEIQQERMDIFAIKLAKCYSHHACLMTTLIYER